VNDERTDVIQVLLRLFSPFRLMKDVNRGSFEERAAAYRHNRSLRGELSACMSRWVLSCGVAFALTGLFDGLSNGSQGLDVFVVLAAACAMFVACGVCVLSVTAYVYVYLGHHDW
jgi:hypothetical protein